MKNFAKRPLVAIALLLATPVFAYDGWDGIGLNCSPLSGATVYFQVGYGNYQSRFWVNTPGWDVSEVFERNGFCGESGGCSLQSTITNLISSDPGSYVESHELLGYGGYGVYHTAGYCNY